MKTILTTVGLLLALTAATFAQTTTQPPESTTTGSTTTTQSTERPLIKEETKQEIREKANEVKQDAREAGQELKKEAREAGQEIKQDVNRAGDKVQAVGQEIKEDVKGEVNAIRVRNDRNGLEWFERGSVFVGASVGLGLGRESGSYLAINPRVGYFFQPGFMAGLRTSFDRRLSTSFRSQELGVFARYYPFRTRVSGFVGAGYNFGREFASNIDRDEKARFNSITLEVGTMVRLQRNLGLEASLETNYYDRSNPLAGRNRGGRARIGLNYYFTRKVVVN